MLIRGWRLRVRSGRPRGAAGIGQVSDHGDLAPCTTAAKAGDAARATCVVIGADPPPLICVVARRAAPLCVGQARGRCWTNAIACWRKARAVRGAIGLSEASLESDASHAYRPVVCRK